jgi:hypothetical protein
LSAGSPDFGQPRTWVGCHSTLPRSAIAFGFKEIRRHVDRVVSCFFSRILPSKARTESWIV